MRSRLLVLVGSHWQMLFDQKCCDFVARFSDSGRYKFRRSRYFSISRIFSACMAWSLRINISKRALHVIGLEYLDSRREFQRDAVRARVV